MSKPNIRKITVDPTKCNADSRRPSVFERLGTKPAATPVPNTLDYCRNWALNGSCSYGKNCKYANTHTLISPSKRAKKDNATVTTTAITEDPFKRLTSKIVKKTSHSPDLDLEEWNQTDLEYEDEKVLERRRQLLQRELELQMKKDKEVHGSKDKTKHKKKAMSSSSSSRSSSTSTSSTTSTSDDSSSSSTSDSRKKLKKVKPKRHHSPSSDYDEDKERRKKTKLKKLGTKSDKLLVKKKRKVDVAAKKDTTVKTAKKPTSSSVRKHTAVTRTKSPVPVVSHASSSGKVRERNRSESPKLKVREPEKDKHYKKIREEEIASDKKEVPKNKTSEKAKDLEKVKTRVEEKTKVEERSKRRSKERRSRTPPVDRSKHQHTKEVIKSRRSRTPEKPSRSKRDPTPPRHQEKPSSSRSRETEKKERDPYKRERSKDREETRKDPGKSRPANQEDAHRKNPRELEDKTYPAERSRQRSKERRDNKDHSVRDERSHSRLGRDRESQRDKERDDVQERCRERQRERDREKDATKIREREIPPLMATAAINPMEKNSRYRDKDRFKDLEKPGRDRRTERERERPETKIMEREPRVPPRGFEGRYDRSVDKDIPSHKPIDRDRTERFPRERSLDRNIVEKNVPQPPPPQRDHLLERDAMYDRDRHRRFNARFDRGHPPDHERKEQGHVPALKLDRLQDRRDSPRRSLEIERTFDRGYPRLEHWDDQEDSRARLDYRDHHEEDRRKPVESRRYGDSPFDERRGRDDRPQRYPVQNDRPFEEIHHPLYPEKLRPGTIRDESSNDNWEMHRDIEHPPRERGYPEWEEREWRARHSIWDRESLPRSEAHDEEWSARFDSPMPDWKLNEARKWENQPVHLRGPYRNDRIKELDLGEPSHGKRRPYNTPELRDECSAHGSKQGSLHGSMKEEPINKKLMELAEGRLRRSREKSADSFQKRATQSEKSEPKEPPAVQPESKRPCVEESLQTLHTESDLSDISDDPDDILDMEDEEVDSGKAQSPKKSTEAAVETQPAQNQEAAQPSPKELVEETVVTKEKEVVPTEPMDFRTVEDENMETMDFEEISDGELEEDIKTSGKGLGDALGVDWESLVKESQPRARVASSSQETAQSRWQCKAIFQRIGFSAKYAGPELTKNLSKKYGSHPDKFLMNDVALLHSAMARKRFLQESSNNLVNDDLLYRYNEEEIDEEEDEEILKPCSSMYDEVKVLLEQSA